MVFTTSVSGRAIAMLLVICMWVGLSALVAREYQFTARRLPKVLAIYALSLAVGIAVVILDDLMGLNG
jgi:hypothetical protein